MPGQAGYVLPAITAFRADTSSERVLACSNVCKGASAAGVACDKGRSGGLHAYSYYKGKPSSIGCGQELTLESKGRNGKVHNHVIYPNRDYLMSVHVRLNAPGAFHWLHTGAPRVAGSALLSSTATRLGDVRATGWHAVFGLRSGFCDPQGEVLTHSVPDTWATPSRHSTAGGCEVPLLRMKQPARWSAYQTNSRRRYWHHAAGTNHRLRKSHSASYGPGRRIALMPAPGLMIARGY